jgi:EAL domain-containing protein (putative c-di-GMP-specific phosphodiesterase class I)/CRP-like cAMP-binding protein
LDRLEYVVVEAGKTVFREGDRGYCAYLIEKGGVEISVARSDARIVLGRRGQGEVFGEMAIIDDKPRSATVTAISDCTLVAITREQLTRRLENSDPILRMCLSVILDRFRVTLMKLASFSQEDSATLSGDVEAEDTESPSRNDPAIQEIRLERELEHALRQDDFELHFQPVVRLHDRSIAGFEALVRWRHPERGLISPVVFIPSAEASGFIVPLGRWCFRQACKVLRALDQVVLDRGDAPDLFMSVNITGRDFSDPNFIESIITSIDETGVDPSHIKLEITESMLMHQPEQAIAALHACKARGLSIAIDDFGTGYSSLSYLHKFPIDTLKIDRSFVSEMEEVPVSVEIIRSIIGLARQLAISVVAEGIENEQSAVLLHELGCQFGQGYTFFRPMEQQAAIALIETGAYKASASPG